MKELYGLVLAKAKTAVEKEKEIGLSAATEKLISTALKLYHATRKEREADNSPDELPPVITAE